MESLATRFNWNQLALVERTFINISLSYRQGGGVLAVGGGEIFGALESA